MRNKRLAVIMTLSLAGIITGPAYAINQARTSNVKSMETVNTGKKEFSTNKATPNPDQGEIFNYKGVTYKLERIKMELVNEKDLINISAKQMDKETALKTCKPYRFTIKNTGNVNFDANLYLGITNNTLGVKPENVRVYIEDNYGNVVLDGSFADTQKLLNKNIRVSRFMDRSFKMWSWVNTPVNVKDGSFEFKVGAFATQGRE